MCVKSLLDGRQQPQRLPLILQRSQQKQTAASTAASSGKLAEIWKFLGPKFVSGKHILQLCRYCKLSVPVNTGADNSCIGYRYSQLNTAVTSHILKYCILLWHNNNQYHCTWLNKNSNKVIKMTLLTWHIRTHFSLHCVIQDSLSLVHQYEQFTQLNTI